MKPKSMFWVLVYLLVKIGIWKVVTSGPYLPLKPRQQPEGLEKQWHLVAGAWTLQAHNLI